MHSVHVLPPGNTVSNQSGSAYRLEGAIWTDAGVHCIRTMSTASGAESELERLAFERAQSIQHRDMLLTGLTHDLRSPLTVVRIEARLLRRGLEARYLETVDNIERLARRMTSFIDGVDLAVHETAEVGMRLERSQSIQLGDALLTSLTNDLREPLAATRLEARSLRQDLTSSYYLDSVDAIERSAIRMTSWIDDVADVASAQNG